jgi:hypothetical protein
VADGDEHAADGQSRVESSRVSRRRTPVTPGLGSSPRISSTTAFVTSSMLRVAARALEHDPRRAELVAAVDDRDLGREPGQERRLLHRRVAAADHRQVAPLNSAPSQVAHADTPYFWNLSPTGCPATSPTRRSR